MQENKASKSRESAMRDGTYLSALWIATFSASIAMFKFMSSSIGLITWALTVALALLSPVFVYKFTVNHRDKECNGRIAYSEAWIYMFIMYACAIVLSSIAQYIFYSYIDPHLFATVIAELEEFSALTGIDPEGTRILTEALRELDKMGAGDIVMSQIGGHISRDILIISVLAFAIKKKN